MSSSSEPKYGASGSQARQSTKQDLFLEILRSAGEARLAVTGASMLPAIWPGDVVTVRRCNAADLRQGDVAFYRRGQSLVAHRVIANHGRRLTTRGDSLSSSDPAFNADDVLGRVVAVERNGGSISPEHSSLQRIVSNLLRRSDFCTRLLLFLNRQIRVSIAGSQHAPTRAKS